MNSITISAIVFLCAFGGAVLGMFLQRVLPEAHLRQESKDVINLGTGLIATMAALVLGLLVGAAKTSFDAQNTGFQQLSTKIILLDRILARYGADAKPAREQLRTTVAGTIERLWPANDSSSAKLSDARITADGAALFEAIQHLPAHADSQRSLQTQALDMAADLARSRWELSQPNDGSLPIPFLVVLAFWLCVLFISFGLFSPRNATVITMLLVCAMSVAGAVFLMVDLDQPFEGLLRISSASLRGALAQLGQ